MIVALNDVQKPHLVCCNWQRANFSYAAKRFYQFGEGSCKEIFIFVDITLWRKIFIRQSLIYRGWETVGGIETRKILPIIGVV